MKRNLLLLACLAVSLFAVSQLKIAVFAEQNGSSPESGADSLLKDGYDFLVGKGANYGATDAADWTLSWGAYWDRIMEAATWEPDGTASTGEVPSGLTFYAGNEDRTIKTGTLFENYSLQDYDDSNCSNNNGESASACAGGDSEYVGEESTWTLTSSGGTAVSVTDNAVTVTLSSNTVYKDERTNLYWADRTSTTIDNEFAYVDGDDRTNPTGNSCNFNSASTANAFCDNQDPLAAYTEDNDVSAAEFCLNLQLDADNADADSNGATGVETDWWLPTQKELMLAYTNGAENNLPNPSNTFWSSTETASSQGNAFFVSLNNGVTSTSSKNTAFNVRCVRRN
jgi:hypothetical protein